LKIFKTFDLNPISLNQKFAKQVLFFAGSPNLISARFLWQPNPTPLLFSEIGPPAISARSLFSFLRSKPPPPISRHCRTALSQQPPPSSHASTASSLGPAPSVSPSLGAGSMLKNRHAIKTH
jgi:hypothetical protein